MITQEKERALKASKASATHSVSIACPSKDRGSLKGRLLQSPLLWKMAGRAVSDEERACRNYREIHKGLAQSGPPSRGHLKQRKLAHFRQKPKMNTHKDLYIYRQDASSVTFPGLEDPQIQAGNISEMAMKEKET